MSSVLGWAGWAGLHSGPSHPAHYLQLVQPSPLARAQAQGAAGGDHLLDQDPAPIKVPTKFRSFNSPLGFEIFDHKIISDCEQMVQFSYSLNMETCAIFPLRLYPQYNASQWLMLDNAYNQQQQQVERRPAAIITQYQPRPCVADTVMRPTHQIFHTSGQATRFNSSQDRAQCPTPK